MTFKENLGLVYFVLPFISVVENKVSLICSILFGKSEYNIKIKNTTIQIPKTNFDGLRSLLACLTYSISYSLDKSKNLAEFDETFKDDATGHVRQNKHKFYMDTQRNILSIAKNIGFILKGKIDMVSTQYQYQYIYLLYKPQ